jgi:uncharacterized protein YggT (Ycf19 family)
MDGLAVSFLVADAASAISRFVDVFITVYSLLILAYIILSWFRLPYSPALQKLQQFLHDACDPYLRLFRRFIPPLGPLDLSPIVAIIVLQVVNRLIQSGLDRV